MGLTATTSKGNFSWRDPSAALLPPSAPKAYSHWGAYLTANGGQCLAAPSPRLWEAWFLVLLQDS
jgi:hypothetical protein